MFGRCIRRFADTMGTSPDSGSFYQTGKYDLGQLESFVHPFTIALAAMQEEGPEIGMPLPSNVG